MQAIFRYFFSILCGALLAMPGIAQQQENEQQQKSFRPSALRLGFALSDAVSTLTDPQATYYAFQADLPLRQFMLNLDYGRASLNLANTQGDRIERNFTYSSQGSFFRTGVDVNLLKDRRTGSNDARGDVIFFGLKYAYSRLNDQISFRPAADSLTSVIYDADLVSERNSSLSTWWLEMNAGVKVEVFRNIFLGYTLRYKFFKRFGGRSSLVPWEVPGFGRGDKDSAFGFDYYIYYRIPFR